MTDDPYREPALYDLEYEHHRDDIAHYVRLARRVCGAGPGRGGPILELGCGNGRITVPIAKEGIEIHGIDVSQPMLDDLARKVRRDPDAARLKIRWSQGDFRHIDVGARRYPLVIWPFNAIHHCQTADDVRAVLRGVKQALRPDGVLGLDCYLPDPTLYRRDPGGRYEERTFTDPRTGEELHSWESGWWDAEKRVHHVIYVYEHPDGTQEEVHLALRMFEKAEFAELFRSEGFDIAWEARDFGGGAMAPEALKWVLELRPRPS